MKLIIKRQILQLSKKGLNELDIAHDLKIRPEEVNEVIWRFEHPRQNISLRGSSYVQVFELKSQGLSVAEIAIVLSVPEFAVQNSLDKDKSRIKSDTRAKEFLRLYKDGESLELISQKFGLTRERVRQVTKKQFGYELGYGPVEQKVRKEEIDRLYRKLVVHSRSERHDDFVNKRLESAKLRGIEPEYFNSISKFLQATGLTKESLKEHRPDVYGTVLKNARNKSKRWSWYYDACRMCNTSTVKHKIYGYCMNCYYKSPEFKAVQQRSYEKTRDNRLEYNKRYGDDYYNRPEVKARLDQEYDEKYFGGNRKLALERDNYQCLGCGMSTEVRGKSNKPLVRVWHLDNKDDNSLDNLGTYCQSCLHKYRGVDFFNKSR